MAGNTSNEAISSLPGAVHFVGVGGAGMSGIAHMYRARGSAVSGSDATDSQILQGLREAGVDVWVGSRPQAVTGADQIVFSSAVPAHDPERSSARASGVPEVHRSVALSGLMSFSRSVAVCGTHGKSTTSALIAYGMTALGIDPNYVIGAAYLDSGASWRAGRVGGPFVIEADESDGSLMNYSPTTAVVTNVDYDHVDHWPNPAVYRNLFGHFLGKKTLDSIICCGDDPGVQDVLSSLETDAVVITYGFSSACDVRLDREKFWRTGASVEITWKDSTFTLESGLLGRQNLLNLAGAYVAVGDFVGGISKVNPSLFAGFSGIHRRLEYRGLFADSDVFEDYAHHPTEIRATLDAVRQSRPAGRVIACFQPHMYSRAAYFQMEFARALAGADYCICLDVFAAREKQSDFPGVSSFGLVEALRREGGSAFLAPTFAAAYELLERIVSAGDAVLLMGAGDIGASLGELLGLNRGRNGSS